MLGSLLLWWNTMKKIHVWRKGFFWLTVQNHCSSLKEVRTGTEIGQEPGTQRWYRGHGRLLFISLFIMAYSSCFLIKPRTTYPETLHNGLGPPHQSLNKKMPYRLVYSFIFCRYFLNWGPFISDDYTFCQVDRKLASTPTQFFIMYIVHFSRVSTFSKYKWIHTGMFYLLT